MSGGALTSPRDAVIPWQEVQYESAPDENQGQKLFEYWSILFKHKWIIIALVAVALAIGLAVTMLTRPVYTASTTIEIDRENANVVSFQDVQPTDQYMRDENFFQTQYGLLKSRSLAENVAQSLGLASDPSFLKTMGATAPASDAARAKWAAGFLQGGLNIYPVRDSRLVKITFDSPNPGLSARIANAFADNFIASNLERRFEASAYARHFLEQHLAQIRTKLEESERQLVAYATQQQIIHIAEPGQGGPGQAGAAPSQSLAATGLGELDTSLTAAKANAVQAEQRWRVAQSMPALDVPEVLADPTVQALRQTRATLATQYSQKLKTFKPDYPDMVQLKAQMDDVDRQLTAAANNIRGALKTQYQTALQQQNALQGGVNHLKASVLDERSREIQYNILQREVDTNRSLYDGLLQRYKEVGVAGGVTSNNISVVDRAQPPGMPSKPQPLHNLAIAGAIGLLLGVGVAFLLEALDQAIRKPADVESKLGLAVLGSIPLLSKGVQPLEALGDARSPFSEAYHSVRTNLSFSTKDGAPRVLAVTSARPEEGKSTTAFALAQGFARLGLNILLIDLDLRNPSMHRVTGSDNSKGASTLLTGAARLVDVVQATNWPNLYLISSGPLPPNPAELLTGPRLRSVIKEATEKFAMVIIDCPPVMGLADAPLIASVATGAVVTIEAGRTSRAQALAAIKRLRMGNAHLLGAILTKFDARKAGSGYGYGYGYSYEYEYQYGNKELEESKANEVAVIAEQRKRKPPPAAE